MAFLIITIVLAADWLLNRNPRPRSQEAPILANRIAQQEREERSKARPPADLAGVHSVEWNGRTGKIVEVQFEEVAQ